METKKIFVLGNGFDLAHYLPTAYIHFMEAMQVVENSHTSSELGFDDLFKSRLDNEDWFLFRTKELYKTDDLILTAEIVDDLREKLKQNGWFQHFKHHLADVDTWIDFETEIENVLRDFSLVFNTAFDTGTVRQHYYNDEEKLAKLQVSKESEVLFNERFFQQFGIKSNKIFPLFFTFNLFRNGYVLREHDRWGDFIDYKILENENDYKNADVRYKHEFKNIIDSYYLKRIGNIFTSFYEDKIFKMLAKQLEDFSKIFELYISNLVNKLNPIKPFPSFEKINDNIELVFTFNYSDTFQRFYANNKNDISRHLHGSAGKRNIVFGISDLDESLKKYKIFDFVKTYQKIINNTDFQFLDEKALKIKKLYDVVTHNRLSASGIKYVQPFKYEIIIWGHSLDVSDKEYIQEIFSLRDKGREHETFLKVYYHQTPHSSLANLMNIMGKDIIQKWVKNKWLIFEETPDIYQIYQVHYEDKDA